MLEVIGEGELDRHALRGSPRQLDQRRAVAVLPGTEEHELRVGRLEQGGAEHQVQALLRHQPRAHAEERRGRLLRQAVPVLQHRLALPFSGEVVDRVVVADLGVGFGIPPLGIDPVENPHQTVGELRELVVQAEPAFRRSQLARMGWTDRDGHVRERQPTLEDVHPAIPLEHLRVVQLRRQAQSGQCARRKVPLEAGVVHRQYRAQPAVERVAGEHGAQVNRRERGVPIVRMQHLRRRRNVRQGRQRRRAE